MQGLSMSPIRNASLFLRLHMGMITNSKLEQLLVFNAPRGTIHELNTSHAEKIHKSNPEQLLGFGLHAGTIHELNTSSGVSEEGRKGWPMRGLETDHVISGPMRGLKKIALEMDIRQTNKQTNRQTNMSTLWLTRPRGLSQWKKYPILDTRITVCPAAAAP